MTIITSSIGKTLRPISGTFRQRIKKSFAARAGRGPLNSERRVVLERCIRAEQNDLEHREPRHTQVEVMNTVRAILLDDVSVEKGGNETRPPNPGPRDPARFPVWPHVDAMAKLIADGPRDARLVAPLGARIGRARVLVLTGKAESFTQALTTIPLPTVDALDASEDDEDGDDE